MLGKNLTDGQPAPWRPVSPELQVSTIYTACSDPKHMPLWKSMD
jgi:hypothetical protein